MSPELLAGIVAVGISLLLEYAPGFASWFQPLGEQAKKLINLGLLVAVAVAVYALSCAGFAEMVGLAPVACDAGGAIVLLRALFGALFASQSVHMLTKRASK